MKNQIKPLLVALALVSALNLQPSSVRAQGTAFTYQGQLNAGGNPANGSYDLQFALYDAVTNVTALGSQTNAATAVNNGLFAATLDFGQVFNATNYWIEMAVRTNGSGPFTTLSPRQPLLPVPQSMYAANAGSAAIAGSASSVAAANIVGTMQVTQLPVGLVMNNQSGVTLAGTFSGNGGSLSNLNAASLKGANALPAGVLPPNVAFLNSNETFTGNVSFNPTSGGVTIGASSTTPEMFEVDGRDTAYSPGCSIRIRNLYDAAGGFVGDAWGSLQFGMYNPSASTQGVIPAGVKRSFFGFDQTGKVGSTANTFGSPIYRNLLDDGAGNITAAGNIYLPATTRTTGIIYSAGNTLMHTFGTQNFFVGLGAGNLTMGGSQNTGIGIDALYGNATGTGNTANGFQSLQNNTAGGGNTGTGQNALRYNTTGSQNTADGAFALYLNTAGSNNVANGQGALFNNTSGYQNTANGVGALGSNTTGNNNTADGYEALNYNTTAHDNTASGFQALLSNTIGSANTANGTWALRNNTTGNNNTAFGEYALLSNTTGLQNAANGMGSLQANTTGSSNTANGFEALNNNTTGSNNIAVGYQAGHDITTGSYNIEIGNAGTAADNNTILIGTQGTQTNTIIAGVYGSTAASGVPVYVSSAGQLGTLTSSARFKENIQDMAGASEVLLSLRPVTFQYRAGIDPQGIPQFGLVAEEVEKVDPGLVARDDKGEVYTVRYEAVNAMLLNEFLKEHRRVEDQGAEIAALKERAAKVDSLEQRLNELEQRLQSLAEKK